MAGVKVSFPSRKVPIADAEGYITDLWFLGFNGLYNRSGGSATDKVDTAATTADTALIAAGAPDPFSNLNLSWDSANIVGQDTGIAANIVISDNTRYYGDGTSNFVHGATVGGAYATLYYIYYDDSTKTNPSPTYLLATVKADAFASEANPDRHFVGYITTPAFDESDTTGVAAASQGATPGAQIITLSGYVTGSGTAGIAAIVVKTKGTATNDSAAAGDVGEYLSASLLNASAIALTTGVDANVTSLSLTAGDWDVSGTVLFTGGATTLVDRLIGTIGQTSATIASVDSGARAEFCGGHLASFSLAAPTTVIGSVRVSLAATTTLYLVAQAVFSTSTASAWGFIRARRVR